MKRSRSERGTYRLLLAAWLWTAIPALAVETEVPTLRVSGEAQIAVPADFASFTIGVQNSAVQAQTALDENSRLMQQLQQALFSAGVTQDQLSSGPFSVQPQWQNRPRGAEAGWRPSITGYQVRAQLLIETALLDRVAGYIEAGVDAGANQVGQLRFSLRDSEAVHQQALAEATALAGLRAQVAAKAAGVELGPLYRIDVDPQPMMPHPRAQVTSMARMQIEQVAPVVAPGTIEVGATVDLTYRLQ